MATHTTGSHRADSWLSPEKPTTSPAQGGRFFGNGGSRDWSRSSPAGPELGESRPVQVHLIDGTFELFRAFYSAPSRKNRRGREVAAASAWFRSLARLVSTTDVTHVAVAFDHTIESFRNELFAGYKTGDGIDPALWQQAGLVEDVTRALGVTCWPMVEFEADDALATAALRFADEAAVERVVIASPDKDLTQCTVHPKVITWDRIRDTTLDARGVEEKFGVRPSSIPDYLALVGDPQDGIPGVPRWGKKAASSVLARYLHLESIPKDAESWDVAVRGKPALGEQLFADFDSVLLYRTLATLRRDVPLPESLDALRYHGASRAAVSELGEELDDPELEQRVSYAD
jgi:5'-3' exonuclease